ncbi:glycosyltransferase [Yersinia ruckeri]|uniref:glycosyltransferase n=1 Tax=Yersinia ruckeri TaxID=29486 RepID=UPI001F4172B8|nr:glycosyltransferase [Yersinia ruckeri]EKN4704105.1 glycosyltransferase [Yersinia ruckeri]UIN06605.1 glycosyltransferase [Yersinia ruckeri]
MNKIIVNATALGSGGALVILNQFVNSITTDGFYYIVFVSQEYIVPKELSNNVKILHVNVKSWMMRIYWDSYGLRKWLRDNHIVPMVIISLQNTSIRTDKPVANIIYLHQALPFVDKKWRFYKKTECKFWLYKIFYSYFIFRYTNDKTQFVVQTNWMKNSLELKEVNIKNIHVIRPSFYSKVESVNDSFLDDYKGKKVLFYPADFLVYKNHIEIVKAFIFIKKEMKNISNIVVVFTFYENESSELSELINDNSLQDNFKFIGKISYSKVLSLYRRSDLIVFPSYLESFGLPLQEAACYGKPIVCADELYSREVLLDYNGVIFVKVGDTQKWALAIQNYLYIGGEFTPINIDFDSSWDVFFELIKKVSSDVQ